MRFLPVLSHSSFSGFLKNRTFVISLVTAIDAGVWRALFYSFLEDCHVEVYCLQAKTLGTRAKVLIPTIKLGR